MRWILYCYLAGLVLISARCAWLNRKRVKSWEDFATCFGLVILWPVAICVEAPAAVRQFRQRRPTRDEIVARIRQNREPETIDDGWSDDMYVARRAVEDDCSTLDES